MAVEITWLGHASFRLASPESVVYIDPWKRTTQPHDADVVFVSHSHYDHCSPPDVQRVCKDDTTIIAPVDAAGALGAARAVSPGETIQVGECTVEATAAYNVGKAFHPKSNNWCGAVFTLAGVRIYYAGDTDRIDEMNDLNNVDIALLPVGGTYTLNAEQAAKVCKMISPGRAIPYHWGDIVGSQADAQAFARAVGEKAKILQPGESITV